MTTTYTKLRDGSWGVRILDESTPAAGQTVIVQKKDGSTKQETIGRIIWTGTDKRTGKPVTLASVQRNGGERGGYYRGQRRGGYDSDDYCYGTCPVGGFRCCPENGPCHDCE